MTFDEFMAAHFPHATLEVEKMKTVRDQWGLIASILKSEHASLPRIEQMDSPRSNKPVANQFIIHAAEGVYFQSYASVIAFVRKADGAVFLDEHYWNYSMTTSKYRHQFLLRYDRARAPETKKNVQTGVYKLVDLNKGE